MKTIKKNKKQNEVQRWAPSIARWRVRRGIDGLRVPPHGCRLAFRWWPWRATNQGAALVRPATNQRVAIREIAHRRLFPRAVINLQSVRIVKKKKGKMAKKKIDEQNKKKENENQREGRSYPLDFLLVESNLYRVFYLFFWWSRLLPSLFFPLIPFELVVFTGFYLVFLLLSLEVGRPMSGSEKRALPIGQSDGPVLERTALETISTSVVEKRYRFKKIR